MSTFSEGTSIPGVEKMVKFKQEVLLKAARDQGHISDNHFQLVKRGACAAYVMAWIVQQYGVATHFHRAADIKSRNDEASIGPAAVFASSQASYIRYPSSSVGSLSALADKFELELVRSDRDREKKVSK